MFTQLANNPNIRGWTQDVPVEPQALAQLINAASLPILAGPIAVMPDVHFGIGATVGSVIPTRGAIIPAAVGVDIGCGMCAVRTDLTAADLPETLAPLRAEIERAVPHGNNWWDNVPNPVGTKWQQAFAARWAQIEGKHPKIEGRTVEQLGTLGGGNHFVEVCLDEAQAVWVMLHSGSRGLGNRIGTYFIGKAREAAVALDRRLPDKDLAWLDEGTAEFADYVEAVGFAQDYAAANRELMLVATLRQLANLTRPFQLQGTAVNCHHNYVVRETHNAERIFVTRKGAVRAGLGDLGIIPGSMGAKSFIVRGKGNPDAYCSCSHGAGRAMSRGEAKRRYTEADHAAATAGVECRKDAGVIDETPAAYKDIDAVMAAQTDLVEVVATLKQVLCVKG